MGPFLKPLFSEYHWVREVEDPPFSPTVHDLFEEAALILSFVATNDKGDVYVRAPVKGYKHIVQPRIGVIVCRKKHGDSKEFIEWVTYST